MTIIRKFVMRLLICLSVLLIYSSTASPPKAEAALSQWEVLATYGSNSNYKTPTPGYDVSTNTIRFGDYSVPYSPGYSYRVMVQKGGSLYPDGYYGLENVIYGSYASTHLDQLWDTSRTSVEIPGVWNALSIKFERQKYNEEYRVFNSYKMVPFTGQILQGITNGWSQWNSTIPTYGTTGVDINHQAHTITLTGPLVRLSKENPSVYALNTAGHPLIAYHYEKASGSTPERMVVQTYEWKYGSIYTAGDYLGKMTLKYRSSEEGSVYTIGDAHYPVYDGQRYLKLTEDMVAIDTSPPVISINPATRDWTNHAFNLSIDVRDESPIRSVEVVTPYNGNWTGIGHPYNITASTNGTYQIRATDQYGNTGYSSYSVTNLDFTQAEISGLQLNYYRTPANGAVMDWSATDSQSGVRWLRNETTGEIFYGSSGSNILWHEGRNDLALQDNAGNVRVYNVYVHMDQTSPVYTVTQSPDGPTNGRVFITLRAWDDGSGISWLNWGFDLEQEEYYWDYPSNSPGQLVVSGYATQNGAYNFTAGDNVGHQTQISINVTNIDKTPPTINISPSISSPTKYDIHLTATGSDNVQVKSITGPDGTVFVGNTGTYTATNNGSYTFTAEDTAGNRTSSTYVVSNIDRIPPTVVGLSILSNGSDPRYAKLTDTFSAIVTFSEEIDTSSGSLILADGNGGSMGQSSGFTKYGTTPNVYITTGGYFFNTTKDAISKGVSFINSVSDIAGNYANLSKIGTTDGSSIHLYVEFPSARITDITTTKSNAGYAIEGSQITIRWKSSQHLMYTPVMSALGRYATTTLVEESKTEMYSIWESKVTVRKEDKQGKMDYEIMRLFNKVGIYEMAN